jgi:HK97 family phage major capsid protein
VNLSQQMIEDSAYDIEAEVTGEFAEQFAVKEGAEFIAGTSANGQAEGVLTNASVTSVVSGAATALTGDGLVNLAYQGLKTAYAAKATWIANRKTIGAIRKLKDGVGNYLWMAGLANNVPNTILGMPYAEMPDMPDEGANLTPIALGDFFRGYRVVDRVLISVLRDPYTVANVGQILYRARKRVGGAVVLAEAICKQKCST